VHNFPFRKPRVNTHFNCRSVIIPVTKSWDELGVEGMDEASGRTRSSMNGYVPQDMTFNDWLKTQSPETIEKTLGKGRAELFMQGKITIRDLITQQGRSINLSDLRRLRDDGGLSYIINLPNLKFARLLAFSAEKYGYSRLRKARKFV